MHAVCTLGKIIPQSISLSQNFHIYVYFILRIWWCRVSFVLVSRDLKKSTGDWFYDLRVNRFSANPGHDLVRISLNKRPPCEYRKRMWAHTVQCGMSTDLGFNRMEWRRHWNVIPKSMRKGDFFSSSNFMWYFLSPSKPVYDKKKCALRSSEEAGDGGRTAAEECSDKPKQSHPCASAQTERPGA